MYDGLRKRDVIELLRRADDEAIDGDAKARIQTRGRSTMTMWTGM